MKNLNNLKQSWLQQIEPRARMLMWNRKRQSTAQGLTVTPSPKKTQQVGHVASVFDPPPTTPTVSQLLSYQIMGTKETQRKQRGRDGRSQGSACCERLCMSTHRKYPSQQSHCAYVWFSHCSASEQNRMEESPSAQPLAAVTASW